MSCKLLDGGDNDQHRWLMFTQVFVSLT